MPQGLQRLREPAAIVLLVVLGLRLVLGVVALFRVGAGSAGPGAATPVPELVEGPTPTDSAAVLLLGLVLASCVLWSQTRHARALLTLGAAVVGLGVLAAVAALVLPLATASSRRVDLGLDLAGPLLALVVPALVLVALLRLRRDALSDGRPVERPAAVTSKEPAAAAIDSRPAEVQHEPTWQPDVAAGAAWMTAGDAATGAAASRWGTPGDDGGWTPQTAAPRPDGSAEGLPQAGAGSRSDGGATALPPEQGAPRSAFQGRDPRDPRPGTPWS